MSHTTVHTCGRLVDGKTKSKAAFVILDARGEVMHSEAAVVVPPPAATEIRGMLVSWLACARALDWLLAHRDQAPGPIRLCVDQDHLASYISWKSRALHPAFREIAERIDVQCTELGIDQAKKLAKVKNRARF